jgi:hypothetical protein
MLLNEYLTILRNSWGKCDGQWAGVKRKLELLVEELRDEDNSNPGKIEEEMHDAFTGELWIDNRLCSSLCYSDRREVLRPFNWEGMWQIVYFPANNGIDCMRRQSTASLGSYSNLLKLN